MDNNIVLPSITRLLNLKRRYTIVSRTSINKLLSYFVYIDKYGVIYITKYPYSISFDELIKCRIKKIIIKEYYIDIHSKNNITYKIKICLLNHEYIYHLDHKLFVSKIYYLKNYDPFGYSVIRETHNLLYPKY
jgi:hypothetical protein